MLLLALLAVPRPAAATLSIIPGRPGHPTPRPTPQVVGSASACQDAIRLASNDLAAAVRGAFSSCLAVALPCILDQSGSASCCAAATPECNRQADAVGRAESAFVAQVVAPVCTGVPFAELAGEEGLDFARTTEACGRLDPKVEVDGLGSLATCLERLVTQDALHLAANTEQPRALEALVCMDLEDRFPGVLRDRPATCEEPTAPVATPTPTPPAATPTPAATGGPGESPTPVGSATPGGPTPTAGQPTPTSGGATCTTTTVTISLPFDQAALPDVSGVAVTLGYPASVSIPGAGSDASVLARVTNLTGISGGIFSVGDQDDAIGVGLVSLNSSIKPGSFASVRFDCAAGTSAPTTSAFTCAVDASDSLGSTLTVPCALAVTTP